MRTCPKASWTRRAFASARDGVRRVRPRARTARVGYARSFGLGGAALAGRPELLADDCRSVGERAKL